MTAKKKAAKRTGGRKKTAVKTAAKVPETVPQPHGGALLTGGMPGNVGGGRPPNWLKDFCDELLADQTCKNEVEAVLRDRNHAAFAQMWRAVADRAHGKPKETVEHSGAVSLEHLIAASWGPRS